jgi:hypothetical protein
VVTVAEETGNRKVDPRLSSSLNSAEIKAIELKNLLGIDGNGIKVAVIDTELMSAILTSGKQLMAS